MAVVDADTEAGPQYAILISPEVTTALYGETSSRYSELRRVIDSLQFNPRPPGAKDRSSFLPGLHRLVVDTNPKTLLDYAVSDEARKVSVVMYRDWRFQE